MDRRPQLLMGQLQEGWAVMATGKRSKKCDRETTHDCLGFEAYVDGLATVCLEPGFAPLMLGVVGSWGSRKTSLMKMLQARVECQPKVTARPATCFARRAESAGL